ncbi:MAG: SufD family Fe-S cluster assembly protein, partial [Cytophagales bacterium]|nr:SufD family Fe-S cluster assembly protein [Cytophagales bacterium]
MEKVFDSTAYLTQRFSDLTGKVSQGTVVDERRKLAFKDFTNWGFPTLKHEEWKYTNVTSILKDGFELPASIQSSRQYKDLIVPGTEEDNHLFFVNGIFDTLSSKIVSPASQWIIKPFYEAELGKEKENFQAYFGISSGYSNDGIGALSTAFANDGVYIEVNSNQIVDKPVHLHFISDGSSHGVLAMPRNLVVLNKNSQIQVVEYFTSIGQENPSLTNLVTEIVVHEDAILEYYKIQLEGSH